MLKLIEDVFLAVFFVGITVGCISGYSTPLLIGVFLGTLLGLLRI